jgi:hypothetical protein
LVPRLLTTCICHAVGMCSRSITKVACMYLVMARSKRGRGDGISRLPIPRHSIDRIKHCFTSLKQPSHLPRSLKLKHPPCPTPPLTKRKSRT